MLQIFKIHNKKEEEQVMDYLNSLAKKCYDAELKRVLSKLENDLQKTIYLDWWYGGSLWKWDEEQKEHVRADRYKHVNEHDWEMATSYIMETVSNGMG